MNAITEARDQLLDAMSTLDVRLYDAFPDVVQPPAVLVEPDDPYVTLGQTYGGSFDVHMRIVVLVSRFGKLAAIDDLLVDVLSVKHGWRLVDVAALPAEALERPDILTTVIRLSKTVYLS